MAVERNLLSGIPTGNAIPSEEAMEVEIDIEEPGMEEIMMGEQVEMLAPEDHYANLAELLDEDTLKELGEEVVESYSADKESREEWESTFERGFDLLGLKLQETTEPFEGSCTAVSPLIIESAVKFQSKATIEMFPSGGPVRTQIVGAISPEREDQANRVQNFMNYQFTEQISEYFDEFEKMLFHLPLIGSAFKKMYYDPSMRRPCSEFVPVDQFYVSYNAPDLQKAERYTHVIFRTPNEMDREVINGMYMDVDLGEATAPDPNQFTSKIDNIMGISPAENYDEQYTLLEQHCQIDLPEPLNNPDGLALPYVITVEENSKKVIAIRRNWSKEDPTQTKQTYFTHYKFVPGFGFYGLGLIHLLGNLTMSATSALRSLVDAGQFSNLPGGFKARGVRVVGSNDPIAPGEFREVEATGLDLQKSIVPLPYKEPSQTLYNMLNFLTTTGQKFADSTEQIVNESSNYGPVGTTMALIESSAKFFSAIHKRLHKSQRDEFRILAKINYEFLPDEYPYDVPNITSSVFKSDFDGRVDVIPVSDPNVPSAAHRLAMAQMVLQLSSQAPQGMYNLENVHMSILKAANIQNPERFFTPQTPPEPHDPITDIQMVTKGMPIQAFPQQDHAAHIAIKTSFIEDPTLGKTEMMAPAVPVLQANIQQHMVMQYQEQMSGMVQMEMQQAGADPNQLSPEVLSQLSIDAAQKILEANSGTGGQSVEEMNYELETARIDLDQQKMQMSATKDAAELAIKNRELDLKEKNVELTAATKVAEKNQKQMDARVREDDSIRGTNTQIVIETLRNMVRERELMIKKREKEDRYATGGSVGYQDGGAILEEFIARRGGRDVFDEQSKGWFEGMLASIGDGTRRSGEKMLSDAWETHKINLSHSDRPDDIAELDEINRQEKELAQRKVTETPVSEMGMDANYFEQIAPIAKPSQIQSAAPVTEEIDVDKYAAFGPASDVKESAEDIRKRTQAEIGTTGETTVDETAAINQMRTNKIQDFREGKHNTLWNKKMKDNDIFAGLLDEFKQRNKLNDEQVQGFLKGYGDYRTITGIRESGGDLTAMNVDDPNHTATGKWQATNANRETNANRLANMLERKGMDIPDWVTQAQKKMTPSEHRNFMQQLNEEEQELLFAAQMFTHKGSDKLLMNAINSGFDEDSLTDLYMKTHHLGTGSRSKTKKGVDIADLYRKDYKKYFGR